VSAASTRPFTLLLPVYAGDRPDFLDRSFHSAVHEQSLRPDQVVVVKDGPLGAALEGTVDRLVAESPVAVDVVRLPTNVGLGPALQAGLAACRHDVVARQDADDISVPGRFARQLPVVAAGAAVVGSGLIEFEDDESVPVGRRTPPIDPAQIVAYARLHQPFFHPTVVYLRSAIEAAGGYEDLPSLEDYWLFARMIARGVPVANVPEPLVLYRVGSGAWARRGGFRLLRSEVELQRRLRARGFTSRAQMARNLAVRGVYRLVPEDLRRRGYRRFVAGRFGHGVPSA
jgi:glycosyltransferase involved in cell wall biosynthesis